MYQHSMDIIFNIIYSSGKLTGTKLYLGAEGCILQPERLTL